MEDDEEEGEDEEEEVRQDDDEPVLVQEAAANPDPLHAPPQQDIAANGQGEAEDVEMMEDHQLVPELILEQPAEGQREDQAEEVM